MALTYTRLEDIPQIHARARQAFASGRTNSIAFRKEQIAQVGYMFKDNEERFKDACKADLGRHPVETDFLEVTCVYLDLRASYDNVEKWTAPQKAEFNIGFWAMGPRYRAEPKGTVLIIAPFNVPIYMVLSPLIGAIAAGNAAVVKPSEQTPAVSALFAELFPKYLDNDLYHVINGAVEETTKILELQWDHIMYTGSGRVARIIAAAAAKHLTPMTLELGGKNPVIVDPKSHLKLAARRVLWGRCLNAGQGCVCPEYVLTFGGIEDAFVTALKEVLDEFYPDGPKASDSLSRIVSTAHAERIKGLLGRTQGNIAFGGDVDVSNRYVSPTLVTNVKGDDSLMSEEIFGPILLLVPVKDLSEAVAFIKARDHPLAVYVFSHDKEFQDKVFRNTKSGAAVLNETMIQVGTPGIPTGGVGQSGYGYYTGKDMFEQFTHKRTTLDNPGWVDKVGFGCRYPPYKTLKPIFALVPSLPARPSGKKSGSSKLAYFFLGGVGILLGLGSMWLYDWFSVV